MKEGIDPLAEKREARMLRKLKEENAVTFADAARRYNEKHKVKWTNKKSEWQFLASLEKYAFPIIGETPVEEITTASVQRVFDPIWHDIPETANRLRIRIERVLSYATVSEWRSGPNSARWKDHF